LIAGIDQFRIQIFNPPATAGGSDMDL
jgi:hypothetical protein